MFNKQLNTSSTNSIYSINKYFYLSSSKSHRQRSVVSACNVALIQQMA